MIPKNFLNRQKVEAKGSLTCLLFSIATEKNIEISRKWQARYNYTEVTAKL